MRRNAFFWTSQSADRESCSAGMTDAVRDKVNCKGSSERKEKEISFYIHFILLFLILIKYSVFRRLYTYLAKLNNNNDDFHQISNLSINYRVFIKHCVLSKIWKHIPDSCPFSVYTDLLRHYPRCQYLRVGKQGVGRSPTCLTEFRKSRYFKEKTQYLMNTLHICAW